MALHESLLVSTSKTDPWSPLVWGQRYRYFLLSNGLDDAELRGHFGDILGPGTTIEPGEERGVSGYLVSTLRELSIHEINSLLWDSLSGVAAPLPEPDAVVESTSSAARRRNRTQPSVTTSSSGGVLLPHRSPEVSIAENQQEVTRLNDNWGLRKPEHVGYYASHLPSNPYGSSEVPSRILSNLRRLEEEFNADDAFIAEVPHTSNLYEACGWYIQNGGALLVIAASLSTALLLIFVWQAGIGPAFTTAGWVLAGGSLLTVTLKTCISERPKRSRRNGDVALSHLTQEGRRRP
ncbi:hypothetical protein MMC27_005796 [Xylographa pallens]|nr:hypothetical protein [Xylographa pallens]